MLRKLMKYEFKATGRTLLPLYGALLLFGLINRILFKGNLSETLHESLGVFGEVAYVISFFVYGCTMAAVFVVTFFVIVQRFHKNILGTEGYLMNTLPVKPYLNIINKLIISTIWTIVSSFVAFLSILIMFVTFENIRFFFSELGPVLTEIYGKFGFSGYAISFEIIISLLVQLTTFITMLYASISIGHLFNKSKILCSFGAFILLSVIEKIITSTILCILGNSTNSLFDNISSSFLCEFLALAIVINTIFFIAYFAITNYILKNKLNLE